MSRDKPIISLLTDFGHQDVYVGVMKTVILRINPNVTFVDLTHDVGPFAVREAAFKLATAYSYFPPETIHLVIVDPGVGTTRRAILASGKNYYFIAPDNGVLSYALELDQVEHLVNITEEHYFLKPVSQTFHGRDIFAPTSGWFSKTFDPDLFGERVEKFVKLDRMWPTLNHAGNLIGEVVYCDRFGNAVTNLSLEREEMVRAALDSGRVRLRVGSTWVSSIKTHFAQCEPGVLSAIAGSSGFVELVVREGSARASRGIDPGTSVELMAHGRG